jgi:hypothetical protein
MKPMSCLGLHFALTADEAARLLAASDNAAVRAVIEEMEKNRDGAWVAQSGKAWDAMHRCLSNGTLFYDEGVVPLNRTLLGGKHLYDRDDYIVSYVAPSEVKDVAAALAPLTEEAFRARYDAIDPDEYDGTHGDEDFKSTWERFQVVRELYKKAAAAGRSVVFIVDQ